MNFYILIAFMAEWAEFPYLGYRLYVVLHKKEGRRMANLVMPGSKNRTTISFARYKYSVFLGRILDKDEQVDHINNDKLDDRIENYQILSRKENFQKMVFENKIPDMRFICPVCSNEFFRDKRRAYNFIHLGRQLFCGKSCARTMQKKNAS